MIKALFPGTFDPIHYGHIDIIERAAQLFDELVVAVYDRPLKTLLFSPEDRMMLAKKSFTHSNITVEGYGELTVEYCRRIGAKVIVRGLRVFSDFEHEFRMALANHRMVPEIETVALITSEKHTFFSATTVREIASLGGDVSSMVPPHVHQALEERFQALEGDGEGMASFTTSLRD